MLISIEGQMGSGKTGTAVLLAYVSHKKGRKIYSNYHLNFPYEPFDDTIFYSLAEQNFNLSNAYVFADEGYMYMSSRLTQSKLNRCVNYYAVQTRKREVDMAITTHTFERLDKWIRDLVNMRISCKHYPGIYLNTDGIPYIKGKTLNKTPMIVAHPTLNLPSQVWVKKPIIRISIKRYDIPYWSFKNLDASKIYPLYDTKEIVKMPVDFGKTMGAVSAQPKVKLSDPNNLNSVATLEWDDEED